MRNAYKVLSLAFLVVTRSMAQPPPVPEIQIPMFLDHMVFAGADSTSWLVTLNYRIDREFFVPVRNADSSATGAYRRIGEVLIELADSTGSSVERQIDRIDLPEDSPLQPAGERRWVQGSATFHAATGTYRIYLEATDRDSQRRQVNRETVARTPGKRMGAADVTAAAFVEPLTPAGADTLLLENLGGDMLFGKNRSLLVGLAIPGDTSQSARCHWALTVIERKDEPGKVLAQDSLPQVHLIRHRQVVFRATTEGVRCILVPDSSAGALAIIPLPTALLPLRNYSLHLDLTTAEGAKASYTRLLRSVWPEMPFSLKNVDGALEALRFITSERQLDSIRSGTFEQRRDALEAFWSARNRSQGTARNDVMTEYYRRVDHAIRNYGTLRIPDGSRSDQGKVFILYGSPTRTDRSLNPSGAHLETWYYDRLKKKFVFVDEAKTGAYTLVATAPL
jgi:GWxTD domain-containing protein